MSYFVIILLLALLWLNFVTNRIPKTGRLSVEGGKEITATITNKNAHPDHSTVLRATDGTRKYRVKLKDSESRLWIKGDEIRIIVSQANPNEYRILFNDYFRENEPRIRKHAFELLKQKVRKCPIATQVTKYNSEKFEIMKNSDINSNGVFVFTYLMQSIDRYSILAGVFVVLTLVLHFSKKMALKELIIPVLLIIYLMYAVSVSIKLCAKTIADSEK